MHVGGIPDPDHSETITDMSAGCGGAATNTGLCLSALGHDVHVASTVGDGERGDRIMSILNEQGITPHVEQEGETTVIYAQVTDDANPRYYDWQGRESPVDVDAIPTEAFETVDHVHVTSFDPSDTVEVARTAKSHGATVSFNPTQGYDGLYDEAFDLLIMNEEEAELFRAEHAWSDVTDETCIVMTNGAAGATVYAPDIEHPISHPGFKPAGPIVDTIGAGDSFNAGFLDAWLTTGDYGAALAQANACGAFAVTAAGAPNTLDIDAIRDLQDLGV